MTIKEINMMKKMLAKYLSNEQINNAMQDMRKTCRSQTKILTPVYKVNLKKGGK